MTQPTANEQEMLYYINRIRINPVAEYSLLVNSGDSDVSSALTFFNVNLTILQSQWNTLTPSQPVAWSEQLGNSSQIHSGLMIQYDQQSHNLPNEPSLGQRITNAGYTWNSIGENIFAFADSIFYAHAGFAIDWGDDDNNTNNGYGTGIQNPPGHRNIIINNGFREIGIDVTIENNLNTDVGSLVITQHFANRTALNNKGWLVGTAFRDLNGDNFYDVGEGLDDVTITITGINGTTFNNTFNSWEAGGYQILLNPGDYQAQFTWEGRVVKSQNFTITSENRLIDLLIEAGLDPAPNTGKIIGNIFDDINTNKIFDNHEIGVAGWRVFLDTNKNQQLDAGETSTITNTKGEYIFNNLTPGVYNVVEVLQSGWVQTSPNANNPNGNETYKLDDGESDGWLSYGSQDHLIFNRFETISSLNTIGSISVALSERGNPTKIFIYQDLDNDDTPEGNEKIREISTSLTGTTGFTTIDIPDTQVSGTFFIAALYLGDGVNSNWIPRDNDIPKGNSLVAVANAGTLNPNSFSTFTVSENNWLLRSNAASNNLPQIVTVSANQTIVNLNFGNRNTNTGNLITGDAASNNLIGGAGNDTIQGLAGNDTLNGGLGSDSLEGGDGNDIYYVNNLGDLVIETATGGTDLVNSSINYILPTNVENLTLSDSANLNGTGNTANNKITGNSGNNILTGGEGNDILDGKAGNDTLDGGIGNDSYVLDNPNDIIIDSTGIDTVITSFNYTLANNLENLTFTGNTNLNGTGNSANNKLTGNSGNNILTGGEGNDTLEGKAGNDTLDGGIGNDSYILDNPNDVIIDSAGIDTVTTSFNYTLANNLENLTLSDSANLNATGNSANNKLTGNIGNNILTGGEGNDSLTGSTGNDSLVGGDGTDRIVESGNVNFTLANTSLTGLGNDTLNSIEQASLTGGSSNNTINASAFTLGNVTLSGGDGNDALRGGSKNDNLTGGNDNDSLIGGNGNDTLIGSAGNDTLTGGGGNDSFHFNAKTEGIDTITDFNVTDDTIHVAKSGFSSDLTANAGITTTQFTTGASATTSAHRFGYDASNGKLWFDADGSGATAAIQFATLPTGFVLTNADIFVV